MNTYNYYSISPLLNAIVSLFCYIYLFKNKMSKPLKARTLQFFILSIFFWSINYFFWQISGDEKTALFLCRLLMVGAIFIPVTFLHFVITFLELDKQKEGKFIKYAYAVGLFFLLADFTPFFINRVEPRLFFKFWPVPSWLFHPFLFLFLFVIIYSYFLFFKNYSKKSAVERNQIKYIFYGTLIGFVGGSTNYFLWYNIKIPPYGSIGVLAYIVTITYCIIKYDLMDIDLASRKFISHILVWLTIVIPFFAIIILFNPSNVWTLPLLSMATLLMLISHNKLNKIFEPAMMGDKYAYIQDIRKLAKEHENEVFHTTDDLMTSLMPRLQQAIHVKNIAVFLVKSGESSFIFFKQFGEYDVSNETISLDDPLVSLLLSTKNLIMKDTIPSSEKYKDTIIETMNKIKAEVAYPLFVDNKLVGILFLGAKTNNIIFNNNDLQELNDLVRTSEHKLSMTLYNERQREIINIAKRMGEAKDFQKLADYIKRSVMRAMDLLSIRIFFYDEKKKIYTNYSFHVLQGKKDILNSIDENNYFIRFLTQKQVPVFARDIFRSADELQLDDLKIAAQVTKKIDASMIIPVICTGKLWGFIVLGAKQTGEEFSMNDFTNCTILMSNASSAIENIVLSDISVRDQLTQLHNRRYLVQMINEEVPKAIQYKRMLVIYLIDIDHFKKINDTLGHAKGDVVLQKVSATISKYVRQMDILVRYGGEEIVILRSVDSLREAEEYGERIRMSIEQEEELSALQVTISIGFSILIPDVFEEGLSYDLTFIRQLMLHDADKGLYNAKNLGRNRICFGGEIKLKDVLGEGFHIKVAIINDDESMAKKQKGFFHASDCEIKIVNTSNWESLISEWCPDVVLFDARYNEKWKDILSKVTGRHITAIVGVCVVNIDEEMRNELQKMGIKKIFVGQGEAREITSWIRDAKESILS
jgi:diguanylate cyclase (GGDEF)-like protein